MPTYDGTIMIYLGNYHRSGLRDILNGAARALKEAGEIALFIGENGECAAYAHYSPDYARHIRVHGKELVGVYRNAEACDRVARPLYNQMDEDVMHHVLGLHPARKAA